MKKSFFLLCAILATNCINAQIEEFERVDETSAPTQSGSPLGLFKEYDGQHMLNQTVPFNLVGEKIFLSNPNPISISRDQTTYALDDDKEFNLAIQILPNKTWRFTPLNKGYYDVIGEYVDLQSINELHDSIKSLKFKTDKYNYYNYSLSKASNRLGGEIPSSSIESCKTNAKSLDLFFDCFRYPSVYIIPKGQLEGRISRKEDIDVMYKLRDSNNNIFLVTHRDRNVLVGSNIAIPVISIKKFIAVRGYETIKKSLEGNEFLLKFDYLRGDFKIFDFIKKQYITFQQGTIFVCKKVSVIDNYIVATLEDKSQSSNNVTVAVYQIGKYTFNGAYNEARGFIEVNNIEGLILIDGNPDSWETGTKLMGNLASINAVLDEQDKQRAAEFEKEKAEKEKKKQSLVRKYGPTYAQDIIDGKASVGMTKEMCKEALGSPDEISKRTDASGAIEIWVYSLYHKHYPSLYPIIVVIFTNDKVTSVNEYTDSNYIL